MTALTLIHTRGFILHSAPFRETSLLLELFTREYGRLGAIARGVRSARRNNNLSMSRLQPFNNLLLSLHGRRDLRHLVAADPEGTRYDLQGKSLYCGFYLNEILIRLLPKMDAYPDLFDYYQQAMELMAISNNVEPILRRFERFMMESIGYGFSWTKTAFDAESICKEKIYRFVPNAGFLPVRAKDSSYCFIGEQILAIAEGNFDNAETLRVAKKIMRNTIQFHLGSRYLQSRKLFVGTNQNSPKQDDS